MSSMQKVTAAAQQEEAGHKQRQSLQQSVTEAMQRYFSDLDEMQATMSFLKSPKSASPNIT